MPGDKTRPVLMAHGIFDSADGWILRGNHSLAMMLSAAGYDLWFLNQRGSRYSRRHKTLNPDKDHEYWDYSFHETGGYDLLACMDYVLKETNQTQLTLIGFSEGTTMSFVLGATNPEQNKKVKLCVCLAPIAYLHHSTGPLDFLIKFGTLFDTILPSFINEIAGYFTFTKAFLNVLCTQLVFGYDLCFRGVMSELIGPNVDAIEPSFFNIIMGHFPAGTSRKTLIHYSQIGQSRTFAAYDHGEKKNLEKYGTAEQPIYDLKKVTMPVYLMSGRIDRVSALQDVELLHSELPNVIGWKIVDDPNYNHLDMMWASTAHEVVYQSVIDKLAEYH